MPRQAVRRPAIQATVALGGKHGTISASSEFNGESNGCVSFSDYPAFLDAYLKGEVDRLVVVEQLATAPGPKTASGWLPAPTTSYQELTEHRKITDSSVPDCRA